MQSKHYVYLGMQKTASSWLYCTLLQSKQIDYRGPKVPNPAINKDWEVYDKFYSRFDFSLSFRATITLSDSDQFAEINRRATHQTITFRNPFEYANCLYNFWRIENMTSDEFLYAFNQWFDYSTLLQRVSPRARVFFYDDIVADPQGYVNKITDYLEMEPVAAIPEKINPVNYVKPLEFTNNAVMLLNQRIDAFQDVVKCDLTHWKR